MRLKVGQRQRVEPARIVGVGQDTRRDTSGLQRRPRVRERSLGRLGLGRRGRRLGLGGSALGLVPAPQRIHARGEAEGDDGSDQEPGGDRADRDQSVVPRMRTCRWLSWFQSTRTTRRGPVKPVFGPT
jgi:hypothetical protein